MVQVVNENQFRNRSVQIEIVEMMNTRYIDRDISGFENKLIIEFITQ